jgi:hypothetical protein
VWWCLEDGVEMVGGRSYGVYSGVAWRGASLGIGQLCMDVKFMNA